MNSTWFILEEEIFPQINEFGGAKFMKVAEESDLQPGWMTWVAAIWLFPSESISTTKMMRIFPYRSIQLIEKRLTSALQQGYLKFDEEQGYLPTEAGRIIARKMLQAGDASINNLMPIPTAKLQRLVDYLARLAGNSLSASEPPPHFFISHYKNMHPGMDVPLIRLYVQYYKELDSYRVDAHTAAWQVYNIEGHTWEVFTYLWRGEANTLNKLYQELSTPGISHEAIGQDLQGLANRGWIKENSGKYKLTTKGRHIREEAEELTNQYFFASWSCLNKAEQEDLFNLATQLRDGLSMQIRSLADSIQFT